MRRPDAAGGEEVVEFGAQRVDRGDDRLLDVRHHPRLAQLDAGLVEPHREPGEVGVLGAAREDLVADHEHGGGYGFFRHDGISSGATCR